MKHTRYIFLMLCFFSCLGAVAQFSPGNIVVYRIGTGTPAGLTLGTGDAYPVFLDEYTPAGVLVRSTAIPVSDINNNKALTASSTDQPGSGMLNRSADGQYLVFTGYNAVLGTTALSGTRSTVNARVIGLARFDGSINTSTALVDFCSRNAPVSATSTNGTDIWCSGLGRADGTTAYRYTTVGSSTSTALISSPLTSKYTTVANGQLYLSPGTPIYTVGSGVPATGTQTTTVLPGIPTTGSIWQFAFADMSASVTGVDVLYIADEINGLQKYSLVGTNWVLNGTVGTDADDYRGLAIRVSGNNVEIFATRKGANLATVGGGELVRLTDAGGYNATFNGTPTILASSLLNKGSFRGLALSPEQAPACAVPANLASYNVAPTSVSFSWSVPGALAYEYQVSSSATPPLAGTVTTATTYTATGLTPGQTYYFHVRTNCSPFNYSGWQTLSVVPTCVSPLALTVNNAGYEVDVNWNKVFGTVGYQYAITENAAPPTSGTGTTDTFFHAGNLSSVTQYYVHVRSNCGSGFAPWISQGFKTGCLQPVVKDISSGDTKAFSWNRVKGSVNYEYALTTYPAAPVGGTILSDTSLSFSKLAPGMQYYFHVRTKCSDNGGQSPWSMVALQTMGLDAYPNPVTTVLNLKLYGITSIKGEAWIADAMGRVVKRVVMTSASTTINMRDLPGGVYLVNYSDGSQVYKLKVLKK